MPRWPVPQRCCYQSALELLISSVQSQQAHRHCSWQGPLFSVAITHVYTTGKRHEPVQMYAHVASPQVIWWWLQALGGARCVRTGRAETATPAASWPTGSQSCTLYSKMPRKGRKVASSSKYGLLRNVTHVNCQP